MTKIEFTERCARDLKGFYKMTAQLCIAAETNYQAELNCNRFVSELLEQDSDEGSRSGTKRVLGEYLYNELQKFKTK